MPCEQERRKRNSRQTRSHCPSNIRASIWGRKTPVCLNLFVIALRSADFHSRAGWRANFARRMGVRKSRSSVGSLWDNGKTYSLSYLSLWMLRVLTLILGKRMCWFWEKLQFSSMSPVCENTVSQAVPLLKQRWVVSFRTDPTKKAWFPRLELDPKNQAVWTVEKPPFKELNRVSPFWNPIPKERAKLGPRRDFFACCSSLSWAYWFNEWWCP